VVVIIDELADLMMQAASEVETLSRGWRNSPAQRASTS
jgi:hypothetical protein